MNKEWDEWYRATFPSVRLSEWQVRVCVATGKKRQHHAVTHRWKPKFESTEEGNILGCYGECGVSNYLNADWPMCIGTDRESGDIILPDGRVAQVKARYPRTDTKGPFARDVKEEWIFIFTQIHLPDVLILGWIEGSGIPAVSERIITAGKVTYPCWRVPLVHPPLQPIENLKS